LNINAIYDFIGKMLKVYVRSVGTQKNSGKGQKRKDVKKENIAVGDATEGGDAS